MAAKPIDPELVWPPIFCLQPPGRLRVSRGHHRINLVDPPELACDLSIADCIEEVAENRVSVGVHVGAFAVPLQGLKFINSLLLGHGVFDLRFGWN
jgi:hypothetical protein